MKNPETKVEPNTTPNSGVTQPSPEMAEVMKQLRELQARDEAREAELRRLRAAQESANSDEVVVEERKPAEIMKLASYEGKPIIDCKLQKVIKTDERGNRFEAGMEAHCTVFGRKDIFVTTYGNLENPDDFLNLPRIDYKLTEQNTADLSGASNIEYKKVISKGDYVDEIDRSSGHPVRTGRKVQLVEVNDIRHYTILVGDEKVTLSQDKIYR